MTDKTKTAKRSTSREKTDGLSADEIAAAKERSRELKASARRSPEEEREAGLQDVLQKIAELPDAERPMAEQLHAIITAAVPELAPRTYYGMPAYAKNGKTICFFQPKSKFKIRYWTLGFQPDAALDEGSMWPIAFALTDVTAADEARIAELVRKAAG